MVVFGLYLISFVCKEVRGIQISQKEYQMKNVSSDTPRDKSLLVFFLLTFTLSWMAWIPMAASGVEVSLSGGKVSSLGLLLIGAFSPSIVGILMAYRNTDKAGKLDFWRRVIDFRQISLGWYAMILLLFPVIMALTFFIESMLGGDIPPLEVALQTLTQPSALFVFIVSMLIGGPLAEELGWRGFALDRMMENWSPLRASLVLGSIHATWHLPLFFMQGTSQGTMGVGTNLFWLWVVQVVAGSIFVTWIYNNNQQSILSAVLIHFMSNATFTLIAQLGNVLPLRTEIIRTAITVSVAAIIVVIWGSNMMILRSGAEPV